jgi:hypothetical protein
MRVSVSGEVAFIVSRLIIDEGDFAFVQGETADDLIFGLLDFLLGFVELRLGGGSLLESGELIVSCRVEVDARGLKLDKRIDISCDYEVVFLEVLDQHIYSFLQ